MKETETLKLFLVRKKAIEEWRVRNRQTALSASDWLGISKDRDLWIWGWEQGIEEKKPDTRIKLISLIPCKETAPFREILRYICGVLSKNAAIASDICSVLI